MEKKYWVKQSWIFNLESMQDKLWCIQDEMRNGEIKSVEIAGKVYTDWIDIDELMDECSNLEWTAKSGKVTGKEYGRIKDIVSWRVNKRYATCMANGMSERDAGLCFGDI